MMDVQCSTVTGLVGMSTAASGMITYTDELGSTYSISGPFGSAFEAKRVVVIPNVLKFTSSQPSALSVLSAWGDYQLLDNAGALVRLEATSVCMFKGAATVPKQSQFNVYANLKPGLNDVDIGETCGYPIQMTPANNPPVNPGPVGATFSAPLRLNVEDDLNSFTVEVRFDPDVVQVKDITQPVTLLGQRYIVSFGNNPPNSAKVTFFRGDKAPMKGEVHISTIVFTVRFLYLATVFLF